MLWCVENLTSSFHGPISIRVEWTMRDVTLLPSVDLAVLALSVWPLREELLWLSLPEPVWSTSDVPEFDLADAGVLAVAKFLLGVEWSPSCPLAMLTPPRLVHEGFDAILGRAEGLSAEGPNAEAAASRA
mmetsp:Transcript_38267/g.108212  ORF Transcript_38267/g.108212 Transcript_38267/m.108212 type:complete len:130 (+) Transcript_38267:1247-1636(+)